MLNGCIATEAGPSSTRMLSVHLQPPWSPAAPGHAGLLPLLPAVTAGREGSGPCRIPRCPRTCHMDLGSCFAQETLSSRTGWLCPRCCHQLAAGSFPCRSTCPPRQRRAQHEEPGTGEHQLLRQRVKGWKPPTQQKGNTDDFYFIVSVKAWLKGWAARASGGNKTCLLR